MFICLRKPFFLILPLFFIFCEESNSSNRETIAINSCVLDISLKDEWSGLSSNVISFLIMAHNTGESTVETIEVTANLYFINDYILKVRFYITELNLEPGDKIESYGIFSDTMTDRFSLQTVSKYELDRIIYNAPIFRCKDN